MAICMMKKKIAILGASRGLGKSFTLKACQRASELLLVSRKENLLSDLKKRLPVPAEIFVGDFSQRDQQKNVVNALQKFSPQILFYCAGGGPHGNFESKEMKDHHWAMEVNFLFPTELLHAALKDQFPQLEQIIFIGSDVADHSPDPQAASYAAAKHALRGLITSVQKEERSSSIKIHLFSPGYMDTDMLPKDAWPRKQGVVENPETIADNCLKIIFG
jgi:short-subunit dehydrogenase